MKMRFAAVVRLCVLGALLVTGAEAAPVPPSTIVKAPDWSAGSEWHYSDGYAVKVNAVSAKGAMFERLDAPGQWFLRQGFIRTDSTSGTATRNAIYRTISDTAGLSLSAAKPLTFQREYLSNGKLLVHASSWTVEGRETITVPAGTFDCWVIVWRTRSMRSDWTGFERWWYSPQVQNYVRMEFKYGPDEDGSRVLMRYNLTGSPLTPSAAMPAPDAVSTPAPPAGAPLASPVSTVVTAAPRPGMVPVKQASTTRAVKTSATFTSLEAFELAKVEITPAKESAIAAPASEPVPVEAVDAPKPSAKLEKAAAKAALKPSRALPKGDKAGVWHAQLGAALDASNVRTSLKTILARNPSAHTLPSGVVVREIEGRTFYRAWLGSYDSAPQARSLCKSLDLKEVYISGCTIFKGPTTMEARAN